MLDKVVLAVLTALADKLELCLRDYQQGGFLPPEKRAISLRNQPKAAQLVQKATRLKVLNQSPMLRKRLVLYAQVLANEHTSVFQTQLSTSPIRNG